MKHVYLILDIIGLNKKVLLLTTAINYNFILCKKPIPLFVSKLEFNDIQVLCSYDI